MGPPFSEPQLIGLAYALEQLTNARRPPRFLPTFEPVTGPKPEAGQLTRYDLAPMKQPLLGIVATRARGRSSRSGSWRSFDFPTFVGWVSFVMLALVPAQIVSRPSLRRNPPFAPHAQPAQRRGDARRDALWPASSSRPSSGMLVGEGASPPGPIPSQFAVIVVPTTFFLAIAFGGWPFTTVSRNMGVAGFLLLVTLRT